MRKKLKILSVIGTRPEAIKMAPVVQALRRHSEMIDSKVCVTAQHRQMLDQVLSLFGIIPDYDLNVMQEGQTPIQVAAAVLLGMGPILKIEKPDWVLVQGDTTTVMAAALAAYYERVKIGHVEAGLRSHNKWLPFPEEGNRKVATAITDFHFAPTQNARQNLLQEGINDDAICITGNPVIDALKMVVDLPYDTSVGPLKEVPWDKRLILTTAHRRENFGKPLENICLALRDIAQCYVNDVHIIYPVHPNPNVKNTVFKLLSKVEGVTLTSPLDYHSLAYLMKKSTLILTDSGGIQEEAPSLGKPVLVLREVTERPEGVDAGTARLVGTNRDCIFQQVKLLLDDHDEYQAMAHASNPYGDGNAADRIVCTLLSLNS